MTAPALAAVVTLACVPIVFCFAHAGLKRWRPRPDSAAAEHADALFLRSLAPTVLALGVSVGIVLPAFLLFEPEHQGERAGVLALALAAVGAVQLLGIAGRAAGMAHASRVITRAWLRDAGALGERWGLPAFAIDSGFPVVAVTGILRPRLLIDRRVLRACSPAELAAIGAHERAHARRRDNLRRLLVGACAGAGSREAAAWRRAAELAADERAADSPARAVDLASALVRVARLSPAPSFETTALSTIHDGGSLDLRVQRLLACDGLPVARPRLGGTFVLVSLACSLALGWRPLFSSVHALVEVLVGAFR